MKTEERGHEQRDALLARVGEHLRGEQKDDSRFERVARGEAAPTELADLEQAAETDAELALRLEASRPLSDDAVARIADRAAAALQKDAKPAKAAPRTNVVALRPSWARRVLVGAGPLALAAGLVLYVAAGPKSGDGADLPSYSVSASGEQAMRGPAVTGDTHLRVTTGKDARFEVVLRPATAPAASVVAYAFAVVAPDAEPSALDAKVEVAKEGSVRVTGASRMLEGAKEIRLVVGSPDAIGKFDDAVRRAKSGSTDAKVRVISVPIDRN